MLFFFSLSISNSFCQEKEGLIRGFCKVSFPEKMWAITHPFVAMKAWRISKQALSVTVQIKNDTLFDGDEDGGQVDAFRHTFWMAKLAQNIHPRKAWKLGLAHEKAGWIAFKKGKNSENSIHDAAAKEMDLRNNKFGIDLGKANKSYNDSRLILEVKKAISEGNVWKIVKNKNMQSLDCEGNIIPKEEYMNKWENKRCIVRSDFSPK
ncbi:MAG TPA: hypothetical protein DEH02_07440 [Bacteroidales bacterium]|nr:hypothetical protein [Bacteroidales bacterium]